MAYEEKHNKHRIFKERRDNMKVKWLGGTGLLVLTHGKVYEIQRKAHPSVRGDDGGDDDDLYEIDGFKAEEGYKEELRIAGRIIEEEIPESDDEEDEDDEEDDEEDNQGSFMREMINLCLELIAKQIEIETGDAKAAEIVRDSKLPAREIHSLRDEA